MSEDLIRYDNFTLRRKAFSLIRLILEHSLYLHLSDEAQIKLNWFLCRYHRLNLENMDMEFNGSIASKFKNISAVVEYMRKFGFKIAYSARKGLFDFEKGKEPSIHDPMEIKHYCVMGRFPLANSIYNDYTLLEKKKLTNEAIDELLYAKKPKKNKKKVDNRLFVVGNLDYAQENAISNLNTNGNIVIYGPPGTGKSQTIVNIITDAISKHKRVLVVSFAKESRA